MRYVFIIVDALTRHTYDCFFRPLSSPLSIAFTPTIHICRCPSTSIITPTSMVSTTARFDPPQVVTQSRYGSAPWKLNRSSYLGFPGCMQGHGGYPEYLPCTTTSFFPAERLVLLFPPFPPSIHHLLPTSKTTSSILIRPLEVSSIPHPNLPPSVQTNPPIPLPE